MKSPVRISRGAFFMACQLTHRLAQPLCQKNSFGAEFSRRDLKNHWIYKVFMRWRWLALMKLYSG
jgi:hypothetical protein